MLFPQFRKYVNEKSYFKIISLYEFEELKIISSYYQLYQIKASTLPDRNFLTDLLECVNVQWIVIGEQEYETKKDFCMNNLQPMPE